MIRLNKKNVCLVTGFIPRKNPDADIIHIKNLSKILLNNFNNVVVFTNNCNLPETPHFKVFNLNYSSGISLFSRAIYYLKNQLKIAFSVIKFSQGIDSILFAIGSGTFIIPNIISKILKKKTIIVYSGLNSTYEYSKGNYSNLFFPLKFGIPWILGILEILNCNIADLILSNSITVDKKISQKKVRIISRFYINSLFHCNTELRNRENYIGYVGKFTEGKGILEFLKAIKQINEIQPGIKFFIVGNGPLNDIVNRKIEELIEQKIIIQKYDWMPQEDLNILLNKLKILVIPSESEVGPQIFLDAFATGTIILGTSTGIMKDILIDGYNGFVLPNNSAECIINKLKEILKSEKLDVISQTSLKDGKKYSLESVCQDYRW